MKMKNKNCKVKTKYGKIIMKKQNNHTTQHNNKPIKEYK